MPFYLHPFDVLQDIDPTGLGVVEIFSYLNYTLCVSEEIINAFVFFGRLTFQYGWSNENIFLTTWSIDHFLGLACLWTFILSFNI